MKHSRKGKAGQLYFYHDEGFQSGFFHTYDKLKLYESDLGRKIHVYLPPDYNQSNESYPVIYMNDGQTAFWPNGISNWSWEVHKTLYHLYSKNRIQKVIIVAIHPNDRDHEYLHVKEFTVKGVKKGGGLNNYSEYLTKLKEFIDRNYRTKKEGFNTAIVGSSHGGLASFYTACTHANYFGVCGSLSPSFWAGGVFNLEDSYLIKLVHPYLSNQHANKPKFWIDWGKRRISFGFHDFFIERQADKWGKEMVKLLQNKYGYKLNKDLFQFEDKIGGHDERAWEYRFGLFLETFFNQTNHISL